MLHIESDGTIKLTRGDTARLTVPITNELDSSEYVMGEEDILTFTIKKTVKDNDPLVQVTSKGNNQFYIAPDDTKPLAFGNYKYDVQLTTAAGDVYTVIEPSVFEVLPEVS